MIKKIKKILYYIVKILNRQQKIYGVVILFLSFIGALLETLGVSVVIPLISSMLTPEKLFENVYIRQICGVFNISTSNGLIALIGAGVITIYFLKNAYFIFLSWMRAKYACKIQRELSVSMMSSYMKRGYSYFVGVNTSELFRGVNGDTTSVYDILYHGFRIIVEMMTVLLICIFMFFADAFMALVVMALACICLLLIFLFFRGSMGKSGRVFREYSAKAYQAMFHAFQGIKEVIVLRKQRYFIMQYEENFIKKQNANVCQTVGSESPAYIIEAICVGGLLVTVCIRLTIMGSPESYIAGLAAFAVGAFRILPSLGRTSSAFNSITYAIPGLKAVYENMIEAKKYNQSAFEFDKVSDYEKECREVQFEKQLQISKLSFAYSEGKKILNHLNMNIPKGQSVAFIGQSGAGKTTLADIILGLLIPQTGQILMDGIDIKLFPNAWSGIIGYVPQGIYLADDTIRFNVAFGINNQEVNDDLIWDALGKAQMDEFVKSLPDGINTFVGDRGVRFSGGQRQRIAIARALYHNPQILILDEATAALDNDTETAVMEAIDALHGKITLIIVAHRLTTIKNCDVVYEIVDGKAVMRDKNEIIK